MTQIDVNQLATALAGLAGGGQQKWQSYPQGYKVAPTTPGVPFLHGPGGLFGVAGIERDIFSSHINGEGLASMLPVMTSVATNPCMVTLQAFRIPAALSPILIPIHVGHSPLLVRLKTVCKRRNLAVTVLKLALLT